MIRIRAVCRLVSDSGPIPAKLRRQLAGLLVGGVEADGAVVVTWMEKG